MHASRRLAPAWLSYRNAGMRMLKTCFVGIGLLTLAAASLLPEPAAQAASGLENISHIIVLYLTR